MADYPEDLRYTEDHEWLKEGNNTTVRVGITEYAASALGDVVFVSLPQLNDSVRAGDSVSELESTKSVSEVFTPISGHIARINEAVLDSPELVTSDPYGDGWLFEVELSDVEELENLLDAAAYAAQLS